MYNINKTVGLSADFDCTGSLYHTVWKPIQSSDRLTLTYYCVIGPDSEDLEGSFRLDSNSGEVWAARLRPGDYSLLVAARDGSGFEAAQVARVQISVLATDATKPYSVFVKSQYSFTVPEDAPVDTAVGTVAVSPSQSGT